MQIMDNKKYVVLILEECAVVLQLQEWGTVI